MYATPKVSSLEMFTEQSRCVNILNGGFVKNSPVATKNLFWDLFLAEM